MLLSEQERILTNEKNLLNNPNTYNPSTTWGQIFDYGNVTTPEDGIVFFVFTVNAGLSAQGDIELFIGGMPVECCSPSPQTVTMVGGAIWLPAGTYDVIAYGRQTGSMSGPSISNLQVGFTQFNDCTSYALQNSSSCSLTVPARTTPVGPLNEAVFAINATALAPVNQLVTTLYITVDGHLQINDESDFGSRVATAKCYLPLSVGTSHSISITSDNASATLYLSVIACPWILTTAARLHQPVTLSFPQMSTLYSIIGILFNDVVKECFVGKPKGVSFGSEDYYGYSSAGTGAIISFSYTFDSVNATVVTLSADGLGCCIDNIAVDVR
ncbi:MAG: hypothetical protein ABSC91_10710 [Candidatus Bathyarchaeia archaeon]